MTIPDLESMDLSQLEETARTLEAATRVKVLQGELRRAETASTWLGESWEGGGRVNPQEYLFDGTGISRFAEFNLTDAPISRPEDRARGDNYPFWRTESEHARIRGICRVLSTIDEVAISAMENLVNYTIGTGLSYAIVPRGEHPTDDDKVFARHVQTGVDKFLERNKIERERDREEFVRLHRDGDDFVGLIRQTSGDGGIPRARLIDPSFVTEPDKPRALEDYAGCDDMLDWKYGIGAPFNDSGDPRYYYVSWYGDAVEWDAFGQDYLVHAKVNVDLEVKRGLSSHYPVWKNLLNAGKLLNNTVTGAAIQAAIAYIRKHRPQATPDQIGNFVAQMGTATARAKIGGGTRTVYESWDKPGRVIDLPNGADYLAGPLGQPRSQMYIEVIQAALRLVGVRFQQPEYMISGDASNGNYASTLVAEAPFTKASEARQGLFVSRRAELVKKAIRIMCATGLIRASYDEVMRRVEVAVEGPAVAVRDRKEAHEIRKGEHQAGILSLRTWAEEAERDFDEEVRRGARPQTGTVPGTGEAGAPATGGDAPQGGTNPAQPQPAAGEDPAQVVAHRNSQVIADRSKLAYPVIAIVSGVGNGTINREAGIGQLMELFGFDRPTAEKLVGPPVVVDPELQRRVSEAWQNYP